MTNYFKLSISYLVMDDNTGTSKKKKVEFIVDAVNYNDAEITATQFISFFKLDELGGVVYEIGKLRVSNLIIDTMAANIEASPENIKELNGLIMVSESDGSIDISDDGFGIYKSTFKYTDLEGKSYNENTHIITSSMDEANNITKLYMNKYFSDGIITNIKKQNESLVLLTKDVIENAKEIYTGITGNK